ncbi:energy transducer TonB [Desulfobacula sp.]
MSPLENLKNTREFLLTSFGRSRKMGVIFLSLSVFVHALFFGGMIFSQQFRLPKPLPPVIQVDLVSFSADPVPVNDEPVKTQEISKNQGIPITPQPAEKKIRNIPNIQPDISLKTKPKNLKDLLAQQEKKKKEPKKKPIEKKEKAPKKIDQDKALEKKIEDKNQDKIAQALSRIQKKVKDQDRTIKGEGNQTSSGTGKKGYKPIDLYKLVLGAKIEQNWVFNDTLARMNQNLETRILIKILKSGEIRDIIYETRSGNPYLDDSAKKAIKKTNPLPPLPPGMRYYDVVVIFTPKGLK